MHRVVLLSIDLILIALASVIALLLRDNLETTPDRLLGLLPYLGLTLACAVPVLLTLGLNRTLWRFSSLADYLRIALAVAATVLMAVSLGFIFYRMDGVARSLPILQAMLMLCALIGVRVAMRLRHAVRSRRPDPLPALTGERQELVLVVGLNTITELFLRSVQDFARERVKVVGLLGKGDRHRGRLLRSVPVLGTAGAIESVLSELEVHGVFVNRVVITNRFEDLSPATRAALLRVEQGSNIRLDFFAERVVFNGNGGRPPTKQGPPSAEDGEQIAVLARLDLKALADRSYFRRKRIVEAAVAGLLVAVLTPVALVVGVILSLAAGSPPIFWQQRPGAGGRPFRLYKFRTMASAHDRQGRRRPDSERLSLAGRLIRRVRLDELPQLYNVLVGQMSFVGPRPLLPADQSDAFAARLAARPGLTGWAQIKGGRELSASDKAVLDIWYINNASFWLDFKILLGTVRMLVAGERTDQKAISRAWAALGVDRSTYLQSASQQLETIDAAPGRLRKSPNGKTLEGVVRLALTPQAAPPAPSSARSHA